MKGENEEPEEIEEVCLGEITTISLHALEEICC